MTLRGALAAWVMVGAALVAGAPLASAQSLGLGRRLDRPLPRAPEGRAPEAPGADDEAPGAGQRPFPGPQIQLHYEHFRLSDGWGGGDVHAAGLGVFIQWPISELRTGIMAEMGARDFALGGDDLLIRGGVEIGFQLTELFDPFVPHISVVAAFGGVVAERFETTVAYGFGGAGIELGADLRIFRNLHVGATFGYLRLEMDGAAYDVLLLRVALGL